MLLVSVPEVVAEPRQKNLSSSPLSCPPLQRPHTHTFHFGRKISAEVESISEYGPHAYHVCY